MKPPLLSFVTIVQLLLWTLAHLYDAFAQNEPEVTCSPCTCAGRAMSCRGNSYIPPPPATITEVVITNFALVSDADLFENLVNITLKSLTLDSCYIKDTSRLVPKMPQLETLKIIKSYLSDDVMTNLSMGTIQASVRTLAIVGPLNRRPFVDPVLDVPGIISETVYNLTLEDASITFDEVLYSGLTQPQILCLNLRHNDIDIWPEAALRQMPDLEELDLSGNRIQKIEEYSFAGERLQKLNFRDNGCEFARFSDGIFRHSPQLRELDISGNNLIRMKPQNLSVLFSTNLTQLEKLSIKNSGVLHLPADMFSNLPVLRLLDLSDNEIARWPPHVFSRMPSLIFLNISSNAISSVDETSFPDTAVSMDLSSNPFACTCDLLWFRRTAPNIQEKLVGFPKGYQCATPSSLAGEPLLSMDTGACETGTQTPNKTVIVSAIVGGLVIIVVLVAAVYFFRGPLLKKIRQSRELMPYYRMHPAQ